MREHSIAQQGQDNGQKNDLEAAVGIHRIQCSAILSQPDANKSFTKWIPACDICWARASVQWTYFHQKRNSTRAGGNSSISEILFSGFPESSAV